MKLLLRIAFDGTEYKGYQVQDNAKTIQGTLNDGLRAFFGFDCDVVGCSRTDSGVHANEFYVAVTEKGKDYLDFTVPIEKFPYAIASFLPKDIVVLDAKNVNDEFHPRYAVKYKEYVYKILNTDLPNPFLRNYTYHYYQKIDDATLERMNLAAKEMCGTHDFTSFMAQGSKITDATRTVKYASVERNGDIVTFRVAADGFLYNMVRIMVGTLLAVAAGKNEPSDVEKIIAARNRALAGNTVPPEGLYLNRVVY